MQPAAPKPVDPPSAWDNFIHAAQQTIHDIEKTGQDSIDTLRAAKDKVTKKTQAALKAPVEAGSKAAGEAMAEGGMEGLETNQSRFSQWGNKVVSDVFLAPEPHRYYFRLLEAMEAFIKKPKENSLEKFKTIIHCIKRCFKLEEGSSHGIKSKLPEDSFLKLTQELKDVRDVLSLYVDMQSTATTTTTSVEEPIKTARHSLKKTYRLLKETLDSTTGVVPKLLKALTEEGVKNPQGPVHAFYNSMKEYALTSVGSLIDSFSPADPAVEDTARPSSSPKKLRSKKDQGNSSCSEETAFFYSVESSTRSSSEEESESSTITPAAPSSPPRGAPVPLPASAPTASPQSNPKKQRSEKDKDSSSSSSSKESVRPPSSAPPAPPAPPAPASPS